VKYLYKARNREGKLETGTIAAYSKEAAANLLQKYNVFVIEVSEQRESRSWKSFFTLQSPVSRKELAIFFRQLAVMMESRVAVVQSLNSLASQAHKKHFQEALFDVGRLVEGGLPLSEAMGNHPDIFRDFYVHLIKSGEVSGNIVGTLKYIADHLERENDIIVQIRQAVVYPVFVMSVLVVVLGIVMFEVIPRIADLLKESQSPPPFFTSVMLFFYEVLAHYWVPIMMSVFLVIAITMYYSRTNGGRKYINGVAFKVPIIREIFKKVFLVRFCSNISTLLVAGVSISSALSIAKSTTENVVYQEVITDIERKVTQGEKLSLALAGHSNYFPPFVLQMVSVGEETGKLDMVLMEIVRFYQKEIKATIDLFSTLIEPMMIIFLGIIVAMLAVSVLSPLYGALGSI
jgi:type IV pilus assembly protein PilC